MKRKFVIHIYHEILTLAKHCMRLHAAAVFLGELHAFASREHSKWFMSDAANDLRTGEQRHITSESTKHQ